MVQKIITNKTKKAFSEVLLSIVLLNCFISLFYIHIHVSPDGQIIVHSNALPHSSSQSQHSHTQLEYLVYHLTTVINCFLIVDIFVCYYFKIIKYLPNFNLFITTFCFIFKQNQKRAPPFTT